MQCVLSLDKVYLLNNLRKGISKKRYPCPKKAVNFHRILSSYDQVVL